MGLTINPYRKAAYDGAESKPSKPEKAGEKSDFARVLDEVTVSGKSQEARAVSKERSAPQGAVVPNKAEYDAQIEKAKAKNPPETNWNAVVDPDGSIYSAAYVGAIASQSQKAERYNEPIHDLLGSAFFRSDLSDAERDRAFEQEKAMLWEGNVKLNDPYALASSGGTRHIDEVDRAARSAAQDKLDALIRDWKAAHGISD